MSEITWLTRKRVVVLILGMAFLLFAYYSIPFIVSIFPIFGSGRGVAITVDKRTTGDWTSEDVIEYENMTQGQQELFDDARNQSGLTYVPDDVNISIWSWDNTQYVRYNGTVYEVGIVED